MLTATLSIFPAFACPGDQGEPLPTTPEALAVLGHQFTDAGSECADSPGFLALWGAFQLAQGKSGEAAALLERALMLNPELAGAKIDYADALASLGDVSAARALIDDVLARSDVSPLLREALRTKRESYQTPRFDDWNGRGSLALKLGRESNLNSAPAAGSFALTLPDGPVVLDLTDRYRPRSGGAWLVEASGQASRRLNEGRQFSLYGEARARGSQGASDADYRQIDLSAAFAQPFGHNEINAIMGMGLLDYGGNPLYRTLRFHAVHDWLGATCRPRLSAEVEVRRYPTSPELDGLFTGISTGLTCLFIDQPIAFSARVGRDTPDGARPGGQQRRLDLRAYAMHLAGAGRIQLDALLGLQRDMSGYSSLLDNDARRHLVRATLRLEYAQPLQANWEAVASAEIMNQRSNLLLFELAGRSVYFGLRRLW